MNKKRNRRSGARAADRGAMASTAAPAATGILGRARATRQRMTDEVRLFRPAELSPADGRARTLTSFRRGWGSGSSWDPGVAEGSVAGGNPSAGPCRCDPGSPREPPELDEPAGANRQTTGPAGRQEPTSPLSKNGRQTTAPLPWPSRDRTALRATGMSAWLDVDLQSGCFAQPGVRRGGRRFNCPGP